MKPTVFRARIDEYDVSLNEIYESFSNFRYKHFHHSSSLQIPLNILENMLHSAEIWMLEWLFMIKFADMYTVNFLMQQARFLERNKL